MLTKKAPLNQEAAAISKAPDTAQARSNRVEQILDGLVKIYAAKGFANVSVDALANQLRCSKATLYELGRSRAVLNEVVVDRLFVQARARLEDRLARVDRLEEVLMTFLDVMRYETNHISQACFRDLSRDPATRRIYQESVNSTITLFRRAVDEGVGTGTIPSAHSLFLAGTMIAMVGEIEWGELRSRTGLSHADAYAELYGLILGSLPKT